MEHIKHNFWERLVMFVENVQVNDPMSEEEKEMILRVANEQNNLFTEAAYKNAYCSNCSVPKDLHGTICGWNNAKMPICPNTRIINDSRHIGFGKNFQEWQNELLKDTVYVHNLNAHDYCECDFKNNRLYACNKCVECGRPRKA